MLLVHVFNPPELKDMSINAHLLYIGWLQYFFFLIIALFRPIIYLEFLILSLGHL